MIPGSYPSDGANNMELSDGPALAMVLGGYELMLPGAEGQPSKILGTREFARYYRQRPRPADERQSVAVNTVLARCAT